jgi:mannose-6-phosphate isomerase-like protein (cupin superfamily)
MARHDLHKRRDACRMSFLVHPAGGNRPHAEANATLVESGGAPHVQVGPASLATFVAPGRLTGGRFGLFRYDMTPQAGGASPHLHTGFSESFYVLSGTVTLFDGRSWAPAGPRSFLHVPEHGVHGFRNDTNENTSILILFAPGTPREAFFSELAEIVASGRQLSEAELAAFYQRHDQYMVDVDVEA